MSGQHCENYDVKRETVHCYPRNVDRCCWNLSALIKIFFRFVLLYNKSLSDWTLGEQWILFPSNLNVSLDFVSGNIEILGKQNSLFPSGPVIKCLLLHNKLITQGEKREASTKTCNETMLRDKLRVFVSRILPPLVSGSSWVTVVKVFSNKKSVVMESLWCTCTCN